MPEIDVIPTSMPEIAESPQLRLRCWLFGHPWQPGFYRDSHGEIQQFAYAYCAKCGIDDPRCFWEGAFAWILGRMRWLIRPRRWFRRRGLDSEVPF